MYLLIYLFTYLLIYLFIYLFVLFIHLHRPCFARMTYDVCVPVRSLVRPGSEGSHRQEYLERRHVQGFLRGETESRNRRRWGGKAVEGVSRKGEGG